MFSGHVCGMSAGAFDGLRMEVGSLRVGVGGLRMKLDGQMWWGWF